MPRLETKRKVDAHWAAYFGCRTEDLDGSRTLVVPHAALSGYVGALAFRRGDACILSVPEHFPRSVVAPAARKRPDEVFTREYLDELFGNDVDTITGPAWLAIADADDFHPAPAGGTRLLGADDHAALHGLAEACGELVWKQSKITLDLIPLFGYPLKGEIVAASGYQIFGGVLAYIGVVTHPGHRGRGFGKAVVSASVRHALEHSLVAQWRTLCANKPAVELAQALGFKQYASTLDVLFAEAHFF